jgi:kinesin family protein 5
MKLRQEGAIKTLLGMARLGHSDVQAQVARGIANFAKCESQQAVQGSVLLILLETNFECL